MAKKQTGLQQHTVLHGTWERQQAMLDERATSRSNGQISRHTQRSEIRGCAHGGNDYDVLNTTDSCLFFMKQAVGVDDIAAELLKTLPWRTVQAITRAFTRRYLGENPQEIESLVKKRQCATAKKIKVNLTSRRTDQRTLRAEHTGHVVR